MSLLKPTEPALESSFPRMRKLGAVVALGLFALTAASGCSKEATSEPTASASGPAVARVNGVDIKESDLALAEEDIGQELQTIPPDQRRQQLIAYVADIILVDQSKDAKSVTDDPDFKQHLAFYRKKLVMGGVLSKVGKAAATDEELHKVYDEAVKSMPPQEEVHARHILVETEDEAKAILEQIKAGADFATLAKEKSKDPGAADGGDLGYFTKEQMVPEFSEVAFKMYPGQVSNPVKTQFGWHIIKVEDKRTKPVPTFDQVKDQIVAFVARKAQSEYVAKLRQSAKIERLDASGHPLPPPAPASKPSQAAPNPDASAAPAAAPSAAPPPPAQAK